jgi:hypothetical protein
MAEKVFVLKKDTHLWDLNQRSWPGLANNPVRPQDAGWSFKTTQLAHHILGGNYYIPEGEAAHGFNAVDCQEYTPPAPVALPSAPVNYPSNPNNKYTVVVPVSGYVTATNAGNHVNAVNTVKPGEYYVFNVHPNNTSLINVTTKLGTPGSWINKADNVIPVPEPKPEPAPVLAAAASVVAEVIPAPAPVEKVASWKDSYTEFPKPVRYIATRKLIVVDLSGQQPDMALPEYEDFDGHEIGVVCSYGTVTKDGIDYYRLRTNNDPEYKYWYAIPKLDAETRTANLLVKPADPAPVVAKATVVRDNLVLSRAKLENEFGDFLDIIPKWLRKNKNNKQ